MRGMIITKERFAMGSFMGTENIGLENRKCCIRDSGFEEFVKESADNSEKTKHTKGSSKMVKKSDSDK